MISELRLAILCLVIPLGMSNKRFAAVNGSLIVQEPLAASVSGFDRTAIGVGL
jgi:hypothetical protein